MSRVRYAKSPRDLARPGKVGPAGSQGSVRRIRIVYETDSEVAQAVVPKPLEASLDSEICVCFDSIRTQLTPDVIHEERSASFGVRVDYHGTAGWLLLAMPMSSESAVILARERFGQPAKLAEIRFESEDDLVAASAARKGVRYLSISARRTAELGPREVVGVAYAFKAFPACDSEKIFDQDPQLVRIEESARFSNVWRLEGELELADSSFDPVADLPVRRIIECEYAEGRLQHSAKALRPVPGDWLQSFLHQRYEESDVEGVEV